MSRLGWHLVKDFQNETEIVNSAYVKRCNPNGDNHFPASRTIGRVLMSDGEEGSYYSRGVAGAYPYYQRCHPFYLQASYCWAFEGPNEPAMIDSPEERRALNEFTVEWAKIMRAVGLRTVGLNFSHLRPEPAEIVEFAESLAVIDYWGQHCYGVPDLLTNPLYGVLYYRLLLGELDAAGIAHPPLILTETGLDDGLGHGWREVMEWPQYFAQLKQADQWWMEDDCLLAALIFTSGATDDFKTFEVGEEESRDLAAYIAETPNPVPVNIDSPIDYLMAPLPVQTNKARWFTEEILRQVEGGDIELARAYLRDLIALAYQIEEETR